MNTCKARGHGVKLQITAHQSCALCTAVTSYPEKQCVVDFVNEFLTLHLRSGGGVGCELSIDIMQKRESGSLVMVCKVLACNLVKVSVR